MSEAARRIEPGPEPYRIAVPEEVLADLRDRLRRTRWPDEIPGAGWEYGTSLPFLRDLLAYWRDGFDWRAREAELNLLPHFRAEIDGLGIHFVHARSKEPRALPILLTHGWPSSFVEMARLIPMLTDPVAHGGGPRDAFHVVVPSLPGYGFSDVPARPGLTKTRIAAMWAQLMTGVLGYERFAARGGDIGAGVTSWLAFDYPERVVGIHVSDVLRPGVGPGSPPLSEYERASLAEEEAWMRAEGAYDHLQATKPQTLAYGLHDSPAALAAWIVEKLRSWSDCGGDVLRRFSRDDLLTILTIYWATGTANSANRLYFDRDREPRELARTAHRGAVRRDDVSRRHRSPAARLGRAFPERAKLDRDAPGRPLRRLGRAGAPRERPPAVLSPASLDRRALWFL